MVKSVIVADDHPSWREMNVRKVQEAFPDVRVDSVETGSELVKRVLEGNYSVVISDNNMEEEGAGLKALQTIRQSGNNIPLYIVCAGSSADARNAIRYGANGFYDKADFDSDKIRADLTQYLE